MMTQVFQSPSGGNWWGKAQNSNSQGNAISAFSESPPRKASTSSGAAEASQAAPDFISCRVKVKASAPDPAGDILA